MKCEVEGRARVVRSSPERGHKTKHGQMEGQHVRITYSSRTKLPKDMPPQLMPPMRLPARDSLRFRFTLSRLGLLTEMGFGPALTNESPRGRPMEGSSVGPVVILKSSSMSMSRPTRSRSESGLAKGL